MTSVFQVPTPADDADALDAAGRRLRAAAAELDHAHAQLVTAGGLAVEQWIGAAATSFTTTHAGGLAELLRVATAHRAHAAALEAYSVQVARTRETAVHARAAIGRHVDIYETAVQRQLSALHAEASRLFEEAKRHLASAGSDVAHLDVAGAVGQAFDAATSAFEGVEDSAVEHLLSHLASWRPRHYSPELVALRPGLDQVSDLTATLVTDELASLGDVLASQALDDFAEVLSAMGLGAAAHAVDTIEAEFAADAAAAFHLAREAFTDLGRTGERIAEEITDEVLSSLTTTWHATEKRLAALAGFIDGVAHDLDLYGLHLALPLIGGIVEGLLDGGHVGGGRRLSDADGRALDDAVAAQLLRDPAAAARYVQMLDLSAAVESKGAGSASVDGWTPVRSIEGPDDAFAELYHDAATGQYALVFRGSVTGDGPNWNQDGRNAANEPTAMGRWAIAQAQQVDTWVSQQPGASLTFAGHSLGGSLAATASIATGASATTFNAAGVGDGNYRLAVQAHGSPADESRIWNFGTDDDGLVTGPQDIAHAAREASGAQITVTSNTSNPFSAHGLSAFPRDLLATNETPGPVTAGEYADRVAG